jgi:hypothetical protein
VGNITIQPIMAKPSYLRCDRPSARFSAYEISLTPKACFVGNQIITDGLPVTRPENRDRINDQISRHFALHLRQRYALVVRLECISTRKSFVSLIVLNFFTH